MAKQKTLTLTEMLLALNDGGVVEDIQGELKRVIKAVAGTGKKGSLTLTLNILPNGPDAIKIVDTVKTTVPKIDQETTFYVLGEDAALTRRNPRQPLLPGQEVEEDAEVS